MKSLWLNNLLITTIQLVLSCIGLFFLIEFDQFVLVSAIIAFVAFCGVIYSLIALTQKEFKGENGILPLFISAISLISISIVWLIVNPYHLLWWVYVLAGVLFVIDCYGIFFISFLASYRTTPLWKCILVNLPFGVGVVLGGFVLLTVPKSEY